VFCPCHPRPAPQIGDDTLLLHARQRADVATQLAVSYGLAQSTQLLSFEKVRRRRSRQRGRGRHGRMAGRQRDYWAH
jgi:hypothetical protein